jgi:lysophospholipase L1-like esterase
MIGNGNRPTGQRLIVLVCVGILLVAAAWSWMWFYAGGTTGSGPAGQKLDAAGNNGDVRAAFQHIWSNRPVLLIGLGDSITKGYGATRGHSYFERLVRNPADEFEDMRGICLSAVLPGLTFQNRAISCTDSMQHAESQVPQLRPHSAETFGIVVMSSGGNDLIHNYGKSPARECAMYGASMAQARPWIASYEKRLNAMLDRITSCFPGGCRIFLMNIYDPTDGTGNMTGTGLPGWKDGLAILHEYNSAIARAAEARGNVTWIDLHALFLGHGLHCRQFWLPSYRREDPTHWYSIVEDPNDRGYDAIRRAMLIAMAQTLPDSLAADERGRARKHAE